MHYMNQRESAVNQDTLSALNAGFFGHFESKQSLDDNRTKLHTYLDDAIDKALTGKEISQVRIQVKYTPDHEQQEKIEQWL